MEFCVHRIHTGPPRNVLFLIKYHQIVKETFEDILSVYQAIVCQTAAKHIYMYIYTIYITETLSYVKLLPWANFLGSFKNLVALLNNLRDS